MKKIFTVCLLSLLMNTIHAQVEWVDRIALTVNQDIITERDIQDATNSLKASLKDKANLPDEAVLRQTATEQLIDKKLVLQIAQRNNIVASSEEIEATIEQLAISKNMNRETFLATLKKEGVSDEMLRKTISENIIMNKITSSYMQENAKVTPDEIQHFLHQFNGQLPTIQEYHVQHIMLNTNKRTDKQARNELLNLRRDLQRGALFETLAGKYSQDVQTLEKGGDLGWIAQGSHPEWDETLAHLKPLAISQPVKSAVGWHLLRVSEKRTVEMSQEQQMAFARNAIMQQKMPQVYQAWMKQLRSTAFISYRKKPY
ncbi:MAG: peptidylprolyl isomerase [Neisseriaceae bacterium]|nr:peptidylprolyl isomerase [Neisseriaceae bacterium]